MSTPVRISLTPHYLGDKWVGIPSIGPVKINGATPTATLARIRMHLVHQNGTVFRLDSDSGETPDAPITINSAANWTAHIPEVQDFVSAPGKWVWDMEFYQTGDTSPITLYAGVLNVTPDITRTV
jgi:hypothetical protein